MKILGIDTSCDDTSISVVKVKSPRINPSARYGARSQKPAPYRPAPEISRCGAGSGSKVKSFKVLSNIVSSQIKIHEKYGGVFPALAKREHQRNLVLVLKKALRKAGLLKKSPVLNINRQNQDFKILKKILKKDQLLFEKLKEFFRKYRKSKIDLLAVTMGPGLEPCLWQGINFAKALSCLWRIPAIPVNHLEAHILANFISPVRNEVSNGVGKNSKCQLLKSKKIFPSICLVVSGGHTELFLMKKIGRYKPLGETLDDAAGECLDKTARLLGLSYPGGPAIEKLASKVKIQKPAPYRPAPEISRCGAGAGSKVKISLPRPMFHSKDYNFSFSGLKTAVLYLLKDLGEEKLRDEKLKAEIAKEIQQSIVDVLITKTIKATREYQAKAIFIGGGVAANEKLKKEFKEQLITKHPKIKLFVPSKKFCLDNGAMVGVAGYFNFIKKRQISWQRLKAKANLTI